MESRLRLAEGFMSTTDLAPSASEYEVRNAYSRAYYGLFHACCAHLLAQGTDPVDVEEIAGDHGRLRSRMSDPRMGLGKWFGRLLKNAYNQRRQSDYEPEWAVPAAVVAGEELRRVRTQFYWLFHTTRRNLG